MLSDDIYQSRQKSWKWRNYKVHHRSTGKDNRHTHNQHALVNFRYVPTDLTNTGISHYTTVLRFMEFTVNQALFWVFYWIFAKPYESSFYKHETSTDKISTQGWFWMTSPRQNFKASSICLWPLLAPCLFRLDWAESTYLAHLAPYAFLGHASFQRS